MSEHRNEPDGAYLGDIIGDAEPAVPAHWAGKPGPADTAHVRSDEEAPSLVPEPGSRKDPSDPGAAEAPDESLKDAGPRARDITVMSPTRDSWDNDRADPEPEAARRSGLFGKRRVAALAAVFTLAIAAGAIGGALAMAGISHFGGNAGASSIQAKLQDEKMLQLESELAALKTNVEHSAKLNVTQFSKTSDRLDKVEKAQAEPAAKIAKLTETVDKLRAAPAAVPVASAPAAAAAPVREAATGSIQAAAPAPAAAPKPEVARLPTVDGWVLRDVADGAAVIESRRGGIYEVYAGDPVPGLGRVDAIRRQDGRWVVVTSRGLIVSR